MKKAAFMLIFLICFTSESLGQKNEGKKTSKKELQITLVKMQHELDSISAHFSDYKRNAEYNQSKLKEEIEKIREIMKGYIVEIDRLHSENLDLKAKLED